jgi:hypothetical protein
LSKPFRSDKRKKELQRLKKQEEKRLRRFGLKQEGAEAAGDEVPEGEDNVTETENNNPEVTQPGDKLSEDVHAETRQATDIEI